MVCLVCVRLAREGPARSRNRILGHGGRLYETDQDQEPGPDELVWERAANNGGKLRMARMRKKDKGGKRSAKR